MPEYVHQADKFTFKVPRELLYSPDDGWVIIEGDRARVGVTDYFQRLGGDIIFAETNEPGSRVRTRKPLGSVETIKMIKDILSPIDGFIVEANPALLIKPEVINEDPYGEGWIVIIKPDSLNGLLTPEAYFDLMKSKIEMELRHIKGV